MNVLFLTASYPTPEAPALAIFVREHARAAAAAGARVGVVHLDRTDVRWLHVEHEPDEEFPTVRVRYPRHPRPASYLWSVLATVLGMRALHRRGFAPDVIHAHFFLAAVPAVILRPWHQKPIVVTEHWSVFLPDDPGTLSPFVLKAAKFALERAELVMPVSTALRDGMRAAGIDARFHIVPNTFDPTVFHPPTREAASNDCARLLTVGAFYEAKGYDCLLEAVAILVGTGRAVQLQIVGEGDLQKTYEQLSRELGIGHAVSFLGWQPKDTIARLMRKSDVFVLASRYDNNPCAAIEALGSGLPIVAPAVGGLPEMIEDGLGRISEPRDPKSLAQEIAAVLDDRQAFNPAAIAQRARDRYGLEHVAAEFSAAYEIALGQTPT